MLQRGVELATLDASWLVEYCFFYYLKSSFIFSPLGYHQFRGMLLIYLDNVVLIIYFLEKIMQLIKQK